MGPADKQSERSTTQLIVLLSLAVSVPFALGWAIDVLLVEVGVRGSVQPQLFATLAEVVPVFSIGTTIALTEMTKRTPLPPKVLRPTYAAIWIQTILCEALALWGVGSGTTDRGLALAVAIPLLHQVVLLATYPLRDRPWLYRGVQWRSRNLALSQRAGTAVGSMVDPASSSTANPLPGE